MAYRRKLDEPGVMDKILKGIDARPRDYWISLIAKYDNEKPGDIVLPGVPPRRSDAKVQGEAQQSGGPQSASMPTPKKASRKVRKAA